MTTQRSVTINFDAQIRLEQRADCWAAYIEPPGMTVYGATEDAVKARIDEALEFFARHFRDDPDGARKLRQYLDAHGVPNFVTEVNRATRMHWQRPVNLLMEVAEVA